MAEVPEDITSRKKAQEDVNGPQEGAKGGHVTSGVRGERTQFEIYESKRSTKPTINRKNLYFRDAAGLLFALI